MSRRNPGKYAVAIHHLAWLVQDDHEGETLSEAESDAIDIMVETSDIMDLISEQDERFEPKTYVGPALDLLHLAANDASEAGDRETHRAVLKAIDWLRRVVPLEDEG